jgi:hypothetical protein
VQCTPLGAGAWKWRGGRYLSLVTCMWAEYSRRMDNGFVTALLARTGMAFFCQYVVAAALCMSGSRVRAEIPHICILRCPREYAPHTRHLACCM